jgi:hypothetical protein
MQINYITDQAKSQKESGKRERHISLASLFDRFISLLCSALMDIYY